MKNLFKSIALFALCISVVSCDNDDDTPAQSSIYDIAASNPEFSTLATALDITGLNTVLDGSGNFTVFAPTNAAFTSFLATTPFATVEDVPVAVLKNILLNHVIGSEIFSEDISIGYASTLSPINTTVNAPTISMFVQLSGSSVILNGGPLNSGATVITADIDASNGVIHVVSNVISIPTVVNHVVANPEFDTLQAIVTSGPTGPFGDQSAVLAALQGLTGFAPATIFAPSNAAFATATGTGGWANGATAAQVTKVLQYHVTTAGNVRSNQLTPNQIIPMITSPVQNTTVILGTGTVDIRDTANSLSRVIQADVQASNGVIHGVNKVLQPVL
jgi:uncharacterized surface protein with fasciclin (FAS1) repeats